MDVVSCSPEPYAGSDCRAQSQVANAQAARTVAGYSSIADAVQDTAAAAWCSGSRKLRDSRARGHEAR